MRGKIQSALLLSLTFGLMTSSAWAMLFQNNLKGIELSSTAVETRVVLKSDAQVPYRVVSQNPNKIVIDLSSVDPSQSIQTDFASAENIEHVILKPLSNNKLRMVIRGERLGAAAVSSLSIPTLPPRKTSTILEQESAKPVTRSRIYAPDENGTPLQPVTPPQTEKAPAATSTLPSGEDSAESTLFTNENASIPESEPFLFNEEGDLDAGNPPLEAATERQPLVDPDTVEETTTLESSETHWQDTVIEIVGSLFGFAKKLISQTDKGILFAICGLSGLVLLLGLFIRNRISQRRDPFALDAEENTAPGFLDWLFGRNAGRNKRERRNRRLLPDNDLYLAQSRGDDRPVGLSGFTNHAPVNQALAANMQPQNLINRHQALNQYAQNATPPMAEPPRRHREEIDRELQRSIQSRMAISRSQTRKPVPKGTAALNSIQNKPQPPNNKQPQPQKQLPKPPLSQNRAMPPQAPPSRTPSTGHSAMATMAQREPGLPANNTEVLDFLRSVAELMEKDGKPGLANGVKRSITSQQSPFQRT